MLKTTTAVSATSSIPTATTTLMTKITTAATPKNCLGLDKNQFLI